MKALSARLALLFSCLGHAYMHLFTAFYFVIALSLRLGRVREAAVDEVAEPAPSRLRSLAFGVKFVLAFAIASAAILLAFWVEGRSGAFTQLYFILAAIAGIAALITCFLPSARPYRPTAVPAE